MFRAVSFTHTETLYGPNAPARIWFSYPFPGALTHLHRPKETQISSRTWGGCPGAMKNRAGSPGIRRKIMNRRMSTTSSVTTVWIARRTRYVLSLIRPRLGSALPLLYPFYRLNGTKGKGKGGYAPFFSFFSAFSTLLCG